MSDLRIALVAEGPTDRIVIQAALRAMLGARAFVLQQLQPEGSLAFGGLGGGWGGVYRWCKQAAKRGSGSVSRDALLFQSFDILLVHLDVDVASSSYRAANVAQDSTDAPLPCDRPCPPASAASDALRSVVLSWCGESHTPTNVVLCLPSRCTETWVLNALFPHASVRHDLECFAGPETWLAQQPVAKRLRKHQGSYLARADDICAAWAGVTSSLSEAKRFQGELLAAS